jgi:redox-sensitive bicupin YhaK (pirin superfamily)
MEKNRRKFIRRVTLSSLGFAALGNLSIKNEKEKEMKKTIKKIRSLGFQWETMDPFLFCVHHEDFYPKGNGKMGPKAAALEGRNLGNDFNIKDGWRMYHGKKVPGFPGHPHRGFETLTVVRKGMVDHSDSAGGAGRYGDGDLQWMTAGKGLLHSEMFPLINEDEENHLELFQIWLNLPAKEKMTQPDYKMFWQEDIPKWTEDNAYIEVLAGELLGKSSPKPPQPSWASDPENKVGVFNIQIKKDSSFTLPKTAPGINRSIYFYAGSGLEVDGQKIPDYHAVDVESDCDIHLLTSDSSVKILILQGKPIEEPVYQHGPFVMNTRKEIQEAFEEYQQTQFGGWPWPEYENVHESNKGRFAKYSNGTIEEK